MRARFQAGALCSWALVTAMLVATVACNDSPDTDAYGESAAIAIDKSSVTVQMESIEFQPQAIRIQQGTEVTWVNRDPVIHNVRQVESVFLSPDVMEEGDMFSYTFDSPGVYRYQCTYHHPTMNGAVIVED